MSNVFGVDFCDYLVGGLMKCGRSSTRKDGRCDRHRGKKSPDKKTRGPRFRGDSVWQVNNGLGNKKFE